MKDQKATTNVIQFPSRKREEAPAVPAKPAAPAPTPSQGPRPAASAKRGAALATVAVVLMSVAVNRFVYSAPQTTEMASTSRTIASVASTPERDAAWEKQMAEQLAKTHPRDLASIHIGRAPTMEEKLRWGTLEENYTIRFRRDIHAIESISFQNSEGSRPAYVLDRPQFLSDYGPLFNAQSAKLKSVEKGADTTIEAYTLFDKDAHAKGEARFELDRYARLLSVKVEPAQF